MTPVASNTPLDLEGLAATPCRNCAGGAWVCENHQDRPWDGTSSHADACGCGAGAPCPVCNADMAFEGRRIATIKECAAVAFAPFDWRFGEAPTTYRRLTNRVGDRILGLQFASRPAARALQTEQS